MELVETKIPMMGHSDARLPCHPLTGQAMCHPLQLHTLEVRVLSDAHFRYIKDERWSATVQEKQLAAQILARIAGMVCPVKSMEKAPEGEFYTIIIRPKFNAIDMFGVPIVVGEAFIPVNYVETVHSVRFLEAQ